MQQSAFGIILKDGIKTVAYFPVWWYSQGLLRVLKGSYDSARDFNQTLGFSIWVRNIFTPIFGQTDFWGRVVSFMLRVANIIVRGFGLLLVAIFHIILVVGWIILPPLVLWQIFAH